ncbi:hypothetical protein TrVE_jg10052 [Triparma verrucosa]|uniref:Protein-serine/threonine kinase n=1 Tax=Triparma verrucosa TaxID=1606542 RepID=A0A9W7DLC5_9STRA|nr:hypothetical protein TrVE_jg10052 [Triparma verrucosa]
MLQSILSLLESNQLLLPTTTSSPQLKNISKTYDSTLQRISNVLSSPTLLQRYNNQDKSAINKAVKEVLTRHSASGSTIEWLFEHSCERLRMGERREDFDIGFEEFISGHYSLLLLCDHYSGLHGKFKRGAVRLVDGDVVELVNDVRDEMLFLAAVAFPDKVVEIEIQEEQPDHLPAFYMVPSAFRYVLMELVKNAVSKSLRVRITLETDESSDLIVKVHDTGGGIDPSIRHGMFEFGHLRGKQYDRLDVQTSYAAPPSDPLEGIGIGLSLSKILAKKYHGDLSIENNDEGGATATFRVCTNGNVIII